MYCLFLSRTSELTGWSEEMKPASRRWIPTRTPSLIDSRMPAKKPPGWLWRLTGRAKVFNARLQRVCRKAARETNSGWLKARK
jgi:hypothetical protein